MKTVIINYLGKSNLFTASKWVSRVLLSRRIWALPVLTLTLWDSLLSLSARLLPNWSLWGGSRQDGEQEQGNGILTAGLPSPRRAGAVMNQDCHCHLQDRGFLRQAQASRMLRPSLVVWWPQMTILCAPRPLQHPATSQASPSLWVEAHFPQLRRDKANKRNGDMCVFVCMWRCVSKRMQVNLRLSGAVCWPSATVEEQRAGCHWPGPPGTLYLEVCSAMFLEDLPAVLFPSGVFSLLDLRPTFWMSSPSYYIQRQITGGRGGRNSSSFVSDCFCLTKGHSWGYVFMENVGFIGRFFFLYASIICCYLNVVNSIQQNYILTQFFLVHHYHFLIFLFS